LLVALLAHLLGGCIKPLLLPVGVALGLLHFQRADLCRAELRRQPQELLLGLCPHRIQLDAHLVVDAAGLVGRDGGRQLLLHLLQQPGVLGQHGAAVPLVQQIQFAAHPVGLCIRQVEVAVQLPVRQLRHLAVGQPDGAASLQQQNPHQQEGKAQRSLQTDRQGHVRSPTQLSCPGAGSTPGRCR
jgi:hypothetical protein